jgi:hypothetical protein
MLCKNILKRKEKNIKEEKDAKISDFLNAIASNTTLR